jgi:hypothetical protein
LLPRCATLVLPAPHDATETVERTFRKTGFQPVPITMTLIPESVEGRTLSINRRRSGARS